MFPICLLLLRLKRHGVVDLWEQKVGGGVWNISFSRNLNDRELDSMERLLL